MDKQGYNHKPGRMADTMDADANREPANGKGSQVDYDLFEEPGMHGIKQALRGMPDLDPPDILWQSVMRSVKTKRLSPWIRLLRWFKSPRSITFTPLQLVPAAAVMVAVCLTFAFHALRSDSDNVALPGNRVPVVLALRFPEARMVAVIGSFNGWQPQNCELKSVGGEAHWTVTLELPAGRYEYAFVVDGEKIIPDPGAGLREDDGFGNQNAILFVGNGNGNSA
jgi:hypothetical protein